MAGKHSILLYFLCFIVPVAADELLFVHTVIHFYFVLFLNIKHIYCLILPDIFLFLITFRFGDTAIEHLQKPIRTMPIKPIGQQMVFKVGAS
jgi:hypothetical protein